MKDSILFLSKYCSKDIMPKKQLVFIGGEEHNKMLHEHKVKKRNRKRRKMANISKIINRKKA